MIEMTPRNWLRDARRMVARLPSMRLARVPDAPALPVRDPWPGDPARGARLLKGELEHGGATRVLRPGDWGDMSGSPALRTAAHGFTWLRDLRALGTDSARLRARALVMDWIGAGQIEELAWRPDVAGARIASWLGHYDFFAASADDVFRQRLMARLVADARVLALDLPVERGDARVFTALKGLIAAAVALPDHAAWLGRALRLLPGEIERQVLPDGSHAERNPSAQLAVLQDLTEIRSLAQVAQAQPPAMLGDAITRLASALRVLRHGDGGLALFNGGREENSGIVDLVLMQAGRAGRPPVVLPDGGWQRLQAGRSLVIVDAGAPPAPGFDRDAHAGTLAFEFSVGRDRIIVNCGAAPAAGLEWRDAMRATAAHSTLVVADTNSSELRPEGLGRRPEVVVAERREAGGAHWLEASQDGWQRNFGAVHHRQLYLSENGEDLRGDDAMEAPSPVAYVVRFHLHPAVTASLEENGDSVRLRTQAGGSWRLRADGARISLEESVYLGNGEPRRAEQVVLAGPQDGPQQVNWAITRTG